MNGMPEDLMETVIQGDRSRRQLLGQPPHPGYSLWKRIWIEPWFNLIGLAVGQWMVWLPWALRWRMDQRIVTWMGARPPAESPDFRSRCREFAAAARRLHRETGVWPAVFVFVSHAPTVGELEWLRFELEREGLQLANAIVEESHTGRLYRPSPECFLAIDPFALDTISTVVAGLYAGFMHRIYLAWDRQSRTQSWLQRHALLRGSGYQRIAQRLINRVNRGIPIVMVLPGGLPQNARLLYTAREFVRALPVRRWPCAVGLAQKKWMDILIRPVNGQQPIEKGNIPEETGAALRALVGEWGFAEADQRRWLEAFAKEFRLEVPYRTRLFRVLFRRIAAKGKPLLWIAAAHRDHIPHINVSEPWGAYRDRGGGLQVIRGTAGPEPVADIARVAEAFSKEFIV